MTKIQQLTSRVRGNGGEISFYKNHDTENWHVEIMTKPFMQCMLPQMPLRHTSEGPKSEAAIIEVCEKYIESIVKAREAADKREE